MSESSVPGTVVAGFPCVAIDLSGFVSDAALFSVLDDALGKLDTTTEVRVQSELWDEVRAEANRRGFKNASEAARYALAVFAFGPERVHSLVSEHLARNGVMAPIASPGAAPAVVRTGAQPAELPLN